MRCEAGEATRAAYSPISARCTTQAASICLALPAACWRASTTTLRRERGATLRIGLAPALKACSLAGANAFREAIFNPDLARSWRGRPPTIACTCEPFVWGLHTPALTWEKTARTIGPWQHIDGNPHGTLNVADACSAADLSPAYSGQLVRKRHLSLRALCFVSPSSANHVQLTRTPPSSGRHVPGRGRLAQPRRRDLTSARKHPVCMAAAAVLQDSPSPSRAASPSRSPALQSTSVVVQG